MKGHCVVCQKELTQEETNQQMQSQPPGSRFGCKKHMEEVLQINRKVQETRLFGQHRHK